MAAAFEQLAREVESKDGEPEDMESKVQRALDCPCVADLKEGPCGPSFVSAFSCYVRSDAPEKGTDCVEHFYSMQKCMLDNPKAFQEFFVSGEGEGGEAGGGGESKKS